MDTLNATWKNDKSTFGYRMLQKMGWKEEKGLGKNESGIVNNIKVKKRDIGLGLGIEQTTDSAGLLGWNATASSFNDVLSVLKETYGASNSKKKKKKDKSNISIGLKYKRAKAAKDLSTKSNEDLNAIFGAARSLPSSVCDNVGYESIAEIPKKKKKKVA